MCGGTCPPLLFGALPVTPASTDVWPPWRSRAHVLPQGRCLGSRGFGLGSPSSRACFDTSARARQRGWRLNSGAPLRTSLRLGAPCALYASDRPVDHLRPPNCRVTSAKAPPPSRVADRAEIHAAWHVARSLLTTLRGPQQLCRAAARASACCSA